MNRQLYGVLTALALTACSVAMAYAWHLDGRVYCEGIGLPFANVQITVVATEGGIPFTGSATTDETGFYSVPLLDVPNGYRATPTLSSNETVVSPPSGEFVFSTDATHLVFQQDWVIASPACALERCWLTGGGTKFSAITGTHLGEAGREQNFGGNVNPGCSPTAGEGGQWNDIAAVLKLHFHGTAIEVIRCGNVDGIPPGSTSPITPFNFIEFRGTGTLKGIKGNKVDYGTVHFFGYVEDRNEPGSNGAKDGALKDRYFLHVFANPADPAGTTLLLVDVDGDPTTVDPVTITDGNLQIHVSSCNTPPAQNAALGQAPVEPAAPSVPTRTSWGRLKVIYR